MRPLKAVAIAHHRVGPIAMSPNSQVPDVWTPAEPALKRSLALENGRRSGYRSKSTTSESARRGRQWPFSGPILRHPGAIFWNAGKVESRIVHGTLGRQTLGIMRNPRGNRCWPDGRSISLMKLGCPVMRARHPRIGQCPLKNTLRILVFFWPCACFVPDTWIP
jgi:hypothetical protein